MQNRIAVIAQLTKLREVYSLTRRNSFTSEEVRILETIRNDSEPIEISDKFRESNHRMNYAALVIINICTIEGLTAPAPGTPSYDLIRAEIYNVLFFSNVVSSFTETEVKAAIRLNADTEPPARIEPYNTLSRRYFSAVLSRFAAIRAAALRKVFTAPEIRPTELKTATAAPLPNTAALAQDLFDTFKNVGEVHPSLIYPDIYDYIYPRLRPIYPQPDKIDDAYKQQWVFDLYTDLIKSGIQLINVLYEKEFSAEEFSAAKKSTEATKQPGS